MRTQFFPSPPGTTRGPYRTSPGNPMKWQYAVKNNSGAWLVNLGNDVSELREWAETTSRNVLEKPNE